MNTEYLLQGIVFSKIASIDTSINSCLLMLQWPFTDKIYNKLCGRITQTCKHGKGLPMQLAKE